MEWCVRNGDGGGLRVLMLMRVLMLSDSCLFGSPLFFCHLLHITQVLYLKEVDQMLALVCITRSENFRKKSLINYNIACLKKALRELMKPTNGGSAKPIEQQEQHASS